MSDRTIENSSEEVPEIPELLEQVLLFALDEAKQKMDEEGEVTPFSALVIKDNVFIETHPGENAEACFSQAQITVQGARGADAYAFCYDGYADTDAGMKDVLIAEGGLPGADEGFAVGYLYTQAEDGTVVFDEDPVYIGPAPNYMAGLKEASEYADDEIAEKYQSDDDDACTCKDHCDCGCEEA